jgi:hypothetical protein
MKFYNREQEIKALHSSRLRAEESAQMTFVVGRRRIGKTTLILRSLKQRRFVYFFVARKAESLLCHEFCRQIETQLKIKIHGTFNDFSSLFAHILDLSKAQHFTLVIDEFQEFFHINPSIYSSMQGLWDIYKNESKLNLICAGSIYSLMYKIFEDAKEPLYGRANQKIKLGPLGLNVQKQIFIDNHISFVPENILAVYMITGGVPKYIELLVERNAFSLEEILNVFFEQQSIFVNEGKDVLIEEFGKDYSIYFSILSLIASSKTSRSEMEFILQKSIGGHLERLEKNYGLIKTVKPILAKPGSRIQKYCIKDNFLNFWFRFCYKNLSALEIANYQYVKNIVLDEYRTYSELVLEKYFTKKLEDSGKYNLIGPYWESKNQNEIDIVALNQKDKKALIAEVKRNGEKIKINKLKEKARKLVKNELANYQVKYIGFSLKDI